MKTWGLIALAACGGSAPAVENHPTPPAFAACIRTRDCIATCRQRHDATACWRAHQLVFFQLDYVSADDLYAESTEYAKLACDAGEPRGCVASAQMHPDRVEDVHRSYAAACEHGSYDGCRQAAIAAQTPADRDRFYTREHTLADAGCGRGDGDACLTMAGAYGAYDGFDGYPPPELGMQDAQLRRYLTAAIAAYEASCTAGDPIACIGRVWVYQHKQLGKQSPHPRTWVERACKLVGAAPGCWQGDEPALFGYDDAGRL